MIRTDGLVKRYGKVVALNGLDLAVPRGTVLGLLGPNGAGKTTAVRILTTLLVPDEGHVEVAGLDVKARPKEVRRKIGLSGQAAAVDEHLTGFENLDMVGRMYHLGKAQSRARARELLDQFALTDAADRPAKTYSGGMRRRLDLAAALVAAPDVIFLDEPTTGLDPRSRTHMWDTIQELVRGGSTVLLTTQYMEEADRLADDIVVIDRGQKIAQGTADDLKRQVGGERIELVVAEAADIPAAEALLDELSVGDVQIEEHARRLTAGVTGGVVALGRVLQVLAERGITAVDVGLRRPTLDDVFLTLTGHAAEEGAESTDDGSEEFADGTSTTREKETV
ncbi:MAG: ATP-binding cassette domain-containing protein [Actinomycetota bacterium]|nr:ATP-binding cassette domain-containing protein [Actinomycetota bacterium]